MFRQQPKIYHSISFMYWTVTTLTLSFLFWKTANYKNGMFCAAKFIPSGHTRNAAVIVQTSRFYHNYRHTANALIHYQVIKKYGKIPDENIILMLADDIAYHPSNPFKGKVLLEEIEVLTDPNTSTANLFNEQVEVDYRGEDVTVDNFIQVLLGQSRPGNPPLQLDSNTNLLIFITGHGGDSFFKFQDDEEILSSDFVRIFRQMKRMNRVNDILFIADTCQAFSLAPNSDKNTGAVEVPDVFSIGSSLIGQNSYSHHYLHSIGHSVVDRFSFSFHQYIHQKNRWKMMDRISLQHALISGDHFRPSMMNSDIGSTDLGCRRKFHQVPLSDFYAMKGVYEEQKRKYIKNDNNVIQLLPNIGKKQSMVTHPSLNRSDTTNNHNSFDDQKKDSEEVKQQCSSNLCSDIPPSRFIDEGMHPSNLYFLFSFGLFCALVNVSSRKW